jgi:hypothetical protein
MRSEFTRKIRICIRHFAYYFQTKGKKFNPLQVTILFQRSVSMYCLAETFELVLAPLFLYKTNKQINPPLIKGTLEHKES